MNTSFPINKHYFYAFGLYIVSEINFPELTVNEEKVEDVHITYGEVPTKIEDVIWSYSGAVLSKNEFLLHIKNVACYYVANGKNIIIQPEENADETTVKQYVLGTCLGTVMLQRGILPIHGSCVVVNEKCIIFTGCSGVGKSTLSAALRKAGYSFLSDDISVISQDYESNLWVQPGLPQQKLTPESSNAIKIDTRLLRYADIDMDKYLLPIYTGFQNTPARLSIICELIPEECTHVSLSPLHGIEKLNTIIRNIYRSEILGHIGMEPNFFKTCLTVAKNTRMYQLKRPKDTFTLEEQVLSIIGLTSDENIQAIKELTQ